MSEKILKYLYDVKQAIDEIDSYFLNNDKAFGEYSKNIILKRAIERNLEIIGEAINRILAIDNTFPINNAKRIVGLRNQIIHAYDNISDENIWGIIINHLPRLKLEIEDLIEKSNQ
ncbi:MAG: HepT-like ribonuclease domain-containing protein [Bacteroidia bacterium]